MKVLVKFPTRGRPMKFLSVLKDYISKATTNPLFLISYDTDDKTMTEAVLKEVQGYGNVMLVGDESGNKIHACNRDIEHVPPEYEWDILILASDDMIPQIQGYDDVIIKCMQTDYPDTDGVLFFKDGYTDLNTMCILGRKYYQRFGYIYHPDYISLWCDNEFTKVADMLGRQTRYSDVLFKHEHPVNNTQVSRDAQYDINEKYFEVDKETYLRRFAINFGL